MAIGMTYEQYWYGDPLMVRAYYKAEQLRQKKANESAWLQGVYFQYALDSVVGNMFRKSGDKLTEYPPQPLDLKVNKEKETEEQRAVREEREKNFALAYMTNMVRCGQNWGKAR